MRDSQGVPSPAFKVGSPAILLVCFNNEIMTIISALSEMKPEKWSNLPDAHYALKHLASQVIRRQPPRAEWVSNMLFTCTLCCVDKSKNARLGKTERRKQNARRGLVILSIYSFFSVQSSMKYLLFLMYVVCIYLKKMQAQLLVISIHFYCSFINGIVKILSYFLIHIVISNLHEKCL